MLTQANLCRQSIVRSSAACQSRSAFTKMSEKKEQARERSVHFETYSLARKRPKPGVPQRHKYENNMKTYHLPETTHFAASEETIPVYSDAPIWTGIRPLAERRGDKFWTRRAYKLGKIQYWQRPDKIHRQYYKNKLWHHKKPPFFLYYLKPLECQLFGYKYINEERLNKYQYLDKVYAKTENEVVTGFSRDVNDKVGYPAR